MKQTILGLLIGMLSLGLGGCTQETDTTPAPPSISGTITAPDNSVADSDVNDPVASFAANDSFASAQAIPNPVSLGGYVNLPFKGADGRSFIDGDQVDVYKVSLTKGQKISLQFAEDAYYNDIDLFLYDSAYVQVAESLGVTSTESITVPSSGDFYLAVVICGTSAGHVRPCSGLPFGYVGATNYNLSIGSGVAAAPAAEFVTGEVIVSFKDRPSAKGGQGHAISGLADRARRLGMQAKAGAAGRPMLMGLGDAQQTQQAFTALGIRTPKKGTFKNTRFRDRAAQQRYETKLAVKALQRRPDVASVSPNYMRKAMKVPNDTFYGYQWHYPLINLPQAWDVTTGNASIVVAVVDTGVYLAHPDLAGQLTAGYDFISNPAIANDGDNIIDNDPDDPGDNATPGSSSFHGTHVAGTIAAATDNGMGVAGIAWQSKIMPVRVLGVGGGTSYDILQGVRYAAGLSNDSGTVPATPARVINLSLGGYGYSQPAQDTYTAVRNQGVIVIAAAANDNTSQLAYPASYDGVVSVSAVDMNKDKAYYSNYGSAIDIAAPGGDVRVDINNDGYADGILSTLADDSSGTRQASYRFYQGTSMAAPHMAGVVALMLAADPGMTPDQLDGLIQSGQISEDLGTSGRDDLFGHGLIDALKAVQVASGGPAPQLVVNPASLNFGATKTSLPIHTYTPASPAEVTSVTEDSGGWISVTGPTLPGLGDFTVTVDRNNLTDGVYSATITFNGSPNTVTVPVTMRVGGTVGGGGDAGLQWVILLDSDNFDTIDTTTAEYSNGSYHYQFSDVKPGDYVVIAGTDSDNDQVLCDAGEACGGYPVLSQLGILTMGDTSLDGIDFVTSFNFELGAGAAKDTGNNAQGFNKHADKRLTK